MPAARLGRRAVRVLAAGVCRDCQLVWASAFGCAGRFNLALFDTPDGQVIARHVGPDTVTRVLDAHFAISKDRFRAEDNKVAQRASGLDPRLRRFTYNPLRGLRALTGFGPGYLCPVPHLAWAKATPWGVYFSGLDHYGDRFTRDLGHLFEQYIGRQLGLRPDAEVIPEIICGPRAGRRKTVDWIVVFSDLVLLVEVKFAFPPSPSGLAPRTPPASSSETRQGVSPDRHHRAAHQRQGRGARIRACRLAGPVMAVTLEPSHLAKCRSCATSCPQWTPVAVADAARSRAW